MEINLPCSLQTTETKKKHFLFLATVLIANHSWLIAYLFQNLPKRPRTFGNPFLQVEGLFASLLLMTDRFRISNFSVCFFGSHFFSTLFISQRRREHWCLQAVCVMKCVHIFSVSCTRIDFLIHVCLEQHLIMHLPFYNVHERSKPFSLSLSPLHSSTRCYNVKPWRHVWWCHLSAW